MLVGKGGFVAQALVRRVFREAVGGVPDRRVVSLLEELRAYSGSPAPGTLAAPGEMPFYPVEFRKDAHDPTPPTRVQPRPARDARWGKTATLIVIVVQGQSNLPEIILALGASRRFAGLLNGREQQRD